MFKYSRGLACQELQLLGDGLAVKPSPPSPLPRSLAPAPSVLHYCITVLTPSPHKGLTDLELPVHIPKDLPDYH